MQWQRKYLLCKLLKLRSFYVYIMWINLFTTWIQRGIRFAYLSYVIFLIGTVRTKQKEIPPSRLWASCIRKCLRFGFLLNYTRNKLKFREKTWSGHMNSSLFMYIWCFQKFLDSLHAPNQWITAHIVASINQ